MQSGALQPPRAESHRRPVTGAGTGATGSRMLDAVASLSCIQMMAGCVGGVTDPKGPVGVANLTLLVDSLAIMLAIVVPIRSYLIGLWLVAALSSVSFYIARSTLIWAPSIPNALSVLALAQIGVHLVFFLHITTHKDSINNILALAFGILIVMLLVFGSLWIMSNLNQNMVLMDQLMKMQR